MANFRNLSRAFSTMAESTAADLQGATADLPAHRRADLADRLPPEARAVLEDLRREVREAAALSQASLDRWHATHDAAQRARSDLRVLVEQIPAQSYRGDNAISADDPRALDAQARLAFAEQELANATQARDAYSERRQRAGRLLESVEKYLRSLPSDIAVKPHTGVEAKLGRNETALAAVERCRRELARLRADLHTVRSAPLPSGQAKAIARQQIESLAERGRPDLFATIEAGEPPVLPTTDLSLEVYGITPEGHAVTGRAAGQTIDAAALLAWLHRDTLIAKLEAEITARADDKAALSDAERRKREADLWSQMLDAERAECAFVAMAKGDVLHREDVDPRALLALASELPAPRTDA
jgi:hypothetical protein